MVAAEPVFQFRNDRIDAAFNTVPAIPPGPQNFKPLPIAEAAVAQHVIRRPVEAGRVLLDVFKQFFLDHAHSPERLRRDQAAPAPTRSPAPDPACWRGSNPSCGYRAM